ncbi:MAG TPA: GNAT family N-acetyltransferase [Acidimicrobiales bacterium]|nr:GNAT family N-acetyltransferase [Acidimicrobiales bacterium]
MDRPPVVVREARRGDEARLGELLRLGALDGSADGVERPGALRAALDEILATPGSTVLVAECGGEVVGLCQLVTFRHLQAGGGRCAELESVHVHPAWRSRGVGGQLLEAAVERADRLGCYRVQLTSNRARPDAHRFYVAHGFVPSHVGFKRLLRRDDQAPG